MRATHVNPSGNDCNCPWGDFTSVVPEPNPHEQEKYGSVEKIAWHEGFRIEASKIEWLRERPDFANERGQKFLDALEHGLPGSTAANEYDEAKNTMHYHDRDLADIKSVLGLGDKDKFNFEDPDHAYYQTRVERLMKQRSEANKVVKEHEKRAKGHDKLFPWLAREWKKHEEGEPGLVNKSFKAFNNPHAEADPFSYVTHDGKLLGFGPFEADLLNQWTNWASQAKKGINLDQMSISDAMQQARKWDQGGDVVHDFDQERAKHATTGEGEAVPEHEDIDPEGWKVIRLRNRRDLVREGKMMNHCVGSHSYPSGDNPYWKMNQNGEASYYSLRDDQNKPHGTVELKRKQKHYYQCPTCTERNGKPSFSMGDKPKYDDDSGVYEQKCENCGTTLGVGHYADSIRPKEDVKTFPNKVRPDQHSADQLEVAQFYGHSDHAMHPHLEALMNHFLGKHGHPYTKQSVHIGDYDEPAPLDHEEAQEIFRPWWPENYDVPGANTVQDYYRGHDHYYYNTPDDYRRATADANRHRETPPTLTELPHDHDAIWKDLLNQHSENLDPVAMQEFFNRARNMGDGEVFEDKAHEWLQQYRSRLDPYGQYEGPGYEPFGPEGEEYNPNRPPQLHGPATDRAVTEPGSHYPESDPMHPYIAANLEHHMNGSWGNPQYEPPHHHRRGPELPRNNPYGPAYLNDVDDERAIDAMDPYASEHRREQPLWDPYYDDVEGRNPEYRQFLMDRGRHERNIEYNERNRIDPDPSVPGHQMRDPHGEYERDEDYVRPQEFLPGMERVPYQRHEGDPTRFQQPQGTMFPNQWYVNRVHANGRRAMQSLPYLTESDLPPHLFPPNYLHLGPAQTLPDAPFHSDTPGQVPLWERPQLAWNDEGRISPINTQNPMQRPFNVWNDEFTPNADQERPYGQWWAKTKEAGAWSDYEEEREQKGRELGLRKNHELEGRVVEVNPKSPFLLPNFEWRRPVTYAKKHDTLYVGQPAMEHADMLRQLGIDENPWGDQRLGGNPDYVNGFIDEKGVTGAPGMHFFMKANIPDEDKLHDWVEDKFGVRAPHDFPTVDDHLDNMKWSTWQPT